MLESALQLAGHYVNRGLKEVVQTGGLRILAIGESTTAWGGRSSYPAQLEEKLQSRLPYSVQVFNEGIPGTNTSEIVDRLPNLLRKYQPQVVILMMGINDFWANPSKHGENQNIWQRLKVLRLFNLIKVNLNAIFNPLAPFEKEFAKAKRSTGEKALKLWNLGIKKFHQGLRKSPENIFDLNALAPAYLEIGKLKYDKRPYQALDSFETYLNYAPELESYLILGQFFESQYIYSQSVLAKKLAKSYYQRGIARWPEHLLVEDIKFHFEQMAKQKTTIVSSARAPDLNELIEHKPGHDLQHCHSLKTTEVQDRYQKWKCFALNLVYEKKRGNKKSVRDIKKAMAIVFPNHKISQPRDFLYGQRNFQKLTVVKQNYNLAISLINGAGAIPVVLQYPTRELSALKQEINSHENVIWVGQKKKFDNLIDKLGYYRLFTDSFAGDFGHCNHFCNSVVAENLADVLMKALPR